MGVLFDEVLPVLSITFLYLDLFDRSVVQTMRGNPVSILIRPRNVEGLNSASHTENVFGLMGIEGVGLEIVMSLQQLELLQRDDEMTVLLLHANTAVAIEDIENRWSIDLKSDGTAVASSCMFDHVALHSPVNHFC